MNYELKLNDIADDLLILNKMTIDTLFRLDNCADCIALYVFYYKTAKWQKTNTIKANDLYVKKSLKWGAEKIKRTKAILKEHGLIDIIQRRKEGKIEGWYIQVSYLVTQKKLEDIKIKVEECNNSQIGIIDSKNSQSNNSQNQEVENPTSRDEEINTLKDKINCLNEKIKMLEDNKENNHQQVDKVSSLSKEEEILKKEFEELWKLYPRKEGKAVAFKSYCKYRKSTKADYITEEDVEKGIEAYNRHIKANNIETKYIKQGSTYFNQRCWEDVYPETKAFEDAPEWFYKDIELDEASEEVSQEMKDLLSAIR